AALAASVLLLGNQGSGRTKGWPCCLCGSLGLDGGVWAENRLQPAADTRRDGFLWGATAFADSLWSGLDRLRGLERLDLFGDFGNAPRRFGAWHWVRAGQAGPELVAKSGELRQAGLVD